MILKTNLNKAMERYNSVIDALNGFVDTVNYGLRLYVNDFKKITEYVKNILTK